MAADGTYGSGTYGTAGRHGSGGYGVGTDGSGGYPAAPPAGWHPDPGGGRMQRWWDGPRWTDAVRVGQWRPVRPLVPFVLTALGLWGIVDVLAIGAFLERARVLGRVRHEVPSAALLAAARHSDTLMSRTAVALVAVHVLTAVAWLCWFRRAYHATGLLRRPRFPGWAVGGWLVPVVSLWRPKQLVNDAWAAGDPGQDVHAQPRRVSPLVQLWWATYLGGNVVIGFVSRVVGAANASTDPRGYAFPDAAAVRDAHLAGLVNQARVVAVGCAVLLVAAALAALLVVRLTQRLEARAT
jgi:hypothetical protein